MALHVTTIHSTTDVVALRIAGTAEERPLLRLIDAIEAAAEGKRRVVLDLDQLVIVSAGPIQSFTAKLVARVGEDRVVLSCRRRSCRQVLRRWGGRDLRIVAELDERPVQRTPPPRDHPSERADLTGRSAPTRRPSDPVRTTRQTKPSPLRGETRKPEAPR